MSKYSDEVARGAALLDQMDKELGTSWRALVDAENLEMESSCGCILGQIFGDYGRGIKILFGEEIEALNLDQLEELDIFKKSKDHGFAVSYHENSGSFLGWKELGNAWRSYLLNPVESELNALALELKKTSGNVVDPGLKEKLRENCLQQLRNNRDG